MNLNAYLSKEVRPWGQFRVYLLNGSFERRWASRFFESLAEVYPEAERDGRLRDQMEKLLTGAEKEMSTTVKIISVNQKSRLSLQYHNLRSEEWFCLNGEAIATLGPLGQHRLELGGTASVPRGTHHRLESAGGADVLEVASGTFDEGDIVRLDDDYARVQGASQPAAPMA